jgi:hypothetical protein
MFVQKKLIRSILNDQSDLEPEGKTWWWSLGVFKKFLDVALRIVSCESYLINHTLKIDLVDRFYSFFYMLMSRPFPWNKEEMKNSEREFQRLWHLSQTYYLTTLIDDDISSNNIYKVCFDKLYNLLGARRAYDETVQNEIEDIFKELSTYLPESEFGFHLARWVEKPSGFLVEGDVRVYTPVKDIVACISGTERLGRRSQ